MPARRASDLARIHRAHDRTGNGRWLGRGVHPDDLERCVSHYRHHFERREASGMEYRLRRHDGAYSWIFDRGVPFLDDHGNFAGFIGSCIDVDERRRAQDAEQQRSRQQLALARDFEKWILAIVSHDIRDPLGTILFAARRLQDVAAANSVAKKHAEMVERGVDGIQHVVGDLLDLAREREGQGIPIEPRRTDLRSLCQQIVDEFEAKAWNRRITFECDVDGVGAWDEHRIVQALSNLVSNAFQRGVAADIRTVPFEPPAHRSRRGTRSGPVHRQGDRAGARRQPRGRFHG
ncbi:MAG TPA: PAS domain-containing sensor histidine kinase [Vicinamibacterales bacterium]|nr:PAS domain-containing sensor histidine kinase [Vicinamibacterales bacterium]